MANFNLRMLSASLLGAGMLATSFTAGAEVITLPNTMKFDINPETKEAVCTYFMMYAFDHEGVVDLPDEIEWEDVTYKVVGIGYHACINNSGLKKLILGKNIQYMATEAVYGSKGLTEVDFNDAPLTIIGEGAFKQCEGLANLTLPETVTTIRDYAFMATAFESFTIPASVDSIGKNPFRAVAKLQSINLPEGYTKYQVKDGALLTGDGKTLISLPAGCGFTDYTIPAGVTEIGDHSMRNNPTLVTITIPEGVERVGEYSMGVMNALTTINLAASVNSIGDAAFYYNKNLVNVNIAEGSPFIINNGYFTDKTGKTLIFALTQTGDVTLPEGLEVLGDYSLYGMTGMTSLTCPSTLKRIGRGACTSCSALSTVNFNEGLEYIGVSAFQSDRALTKVILPSTMLELDKQAFTYCSGITELSLNDGLKKMGQMAFYNCAALPSVSVPGTLEEWGDACFYQCNVLTEATIGEGITVLPDGTFNWCSWLQKCTLPESLKVIGDACFSMNTSLSECNIPAGVEIIGSTAFQSTAIEEVTVPVGVTVISDFAFATMKQLKRLTLHDGIERIEHHGIHGNDNVEEIYLGPKLKYIGEKGISLNHTITSLTIPKSVEEFGEFALNFNTGMKDLYIENPTPLELQYDFFDPEAYAFPAYEEITLHVPKGTLDAYMDAPIWKKFENIVDDMPNDSKVGSIDAAKAIKSVRIFELNGNLVAEPEFGQPYVKEITFEDGSVMTVKIIGE